MIERKDEAITDTLENGQVDRIFLQEITISAQADRRVGAESVVRLFNSKVRLGANGEDIQNVPVRAQTVDVTIEEFLIKAGMTYLEFVNIWADILEEKLNPVVTGGE